MRFCSPARATSRSIVSSSSSARIDLPIAEVCSGMEAPTRDGIRYGLSESVRTR